MFLTKKALIKNPLSSSDVQVMFYKNYDHKPALKYAYCQRYRKKLRIKCGHGSFLINFLDNFRM
jgi:hypothetical protein